MASEPRLKPHCALLHRGDRRRRPRHRQPCHRRHTTFAGTIDGVRIEIGDDDHTHLIAPEHLLEIALIKQ
jgi:hypothetical protein